MNKPTKEELNDLRDKCYKNACDHGFHDVELSERHFLCLVISELMEAVDADRKERHAKVELYNRASRMSDEVKGFEHFIKDTVEDELADAAIRIFDLAGMTEYPLHFDEIICDDNENQFYKDKTFAELMYAIVKHVVFESLDIVLFELFGLADYLGFDLMEHIKLKMKYNSTRPRMHGKRY